MLLQMFSSTSWSFRCQSLGSSSQDVLPPVSAIQTDGFQGFTACVFRRPDGVRAVFPDPGADARFQVRGGALKKIAPSGGRRENFWVFRVKNHDFTPKNHIFSNFRGGGARAGCARPPGSAPETNIFIYDLQRDGRGRYCSTIGTTFSLQLPGDHEFEPVRAALQLRQRYGEVQPQFPVFEM